MFLASNTGNMDDLYSTKAYNVTLNILLKGTTTSFNVTNWLDTVNTYASAITNVIAGATGISKSGPTIGQDFIYYDSSPTSGGPVFTIISYNSAVVGKPVNLTVIKNDGSVNHSSYYNTTADNGPTWYNPALNTRAVFAAVTVTGGNNYWKVSVPASIMNVGGTLTGANCGSTTYTDGNYAASVTINSAADWSGTYTIIPVRVNNQQYQTYVFLTQTVAPAATNIWV